MDNKARAAPLKEILTYDKKEFETLKCYHFSYPKLFSIIFHLFQNGETTGPANLLAGGQRHL